MKKRTTMAAALAASSLSAPTASAYSNNQQVQYIVSMGLGYCMTEVGRFTKDEAAEWFVQYMRKQGIPDSFVTRMQNNIPASQIVAWINQQGGCRKLTAGIGQSPSPGVLPTNFQSPSEVLSDTPFRF